MTGSTAGSTPPLERLTIILAVLSRAGGAPVDADYLLQKVVYGAGQVQDRRDQLRRDITNLENLGWVIRNIAAAGEMARYRLVAVDNRLMLQLTPHQRFELMRAAILSGTTEQVGIGDDVAPQQEGSSFHGVQAGTVDRQVEDARWAAARQCLVRFRYKGRPRTAHPQAVHLRPGGWYLTAREVGDTTVKTFAIERIEDLTLDGPGTADPPPADPVRPALDPISWEVDPPLDAVVTTTPDHRSRVETLLGTATSALTRDAGSTVVLTIPVTSRAAFRSRLYQLGTRARLEGPPELRREVRDELLAAVAAATPGGAS